MKIRPGDRVTVHFRCSLPSGFVLDATPDETPFTMLAGSPDILPGFDAALRGRGPGDIFTVRIPAVHAFGQFDPKRITETPRSNLPEGIVIKPGTVLRVPHEDKACLATILKCNEGSVTIDFNHPLSDHDLVFHIRIIDVRR